MAEAATRSGACPRAAERDFLALDALRELM
jgi:hypothetical protein